MKKNTSQVGRKLHPRAKKSQGRKPRRPDVFPDAPAEMLRVPIGMAFKAEVIEAAKREECSVEELTRRALFVAISDAAPRPAVNARGKGVFTITLPEPLAARVVKVAELTRSPVDDVFIAAIEDWMSAGKSEAAPAPAAPVPPASGGTAAAGVPMRRETVTDHLARKRPERGEEQDMEIQVHGLNPDTTFPFLTIFYFVCRVLDECGDYLAKVVALELGAEEQAMLMEALAYAEQWRYQEAKGEFPKELMLPGALPGLAAQRSMGREDFLMWVCHFLSFPSVLGAITKHFLEPSAALINRIEWGEVLAVAEVVVGRDSAELKLAPDGRAEWKAAFLMPKAERKAEVAA